MNAEEYPPIKTRMLFSDEEVGAICDRLRALACPVSWQQFSNHSEFRVCSSPGLQTPDGKPWEKWNQIHSFVAGMEMMRDLTVLMGRTTI